MRQQETVKGNAITPTEYKAFQQAYDFFNKQLFDKSLPPVLITLQRHAKMSGYFAPDRFTGRNGDNTTQEQSLNPDGFTGKATNGFSLSWYTRWRTSGSKSTGRCPRAAIMIDSGRPK